MSKDKPQVSVDSDVRVDPTLPDCFKLVAANLTVFASDALKYIGHAHLSHGLYSEAIDAYVSAFVSIFHGLPINDDQKEQIKQLILTRWDQQAFLQKNGIDSLPMSGDPSTSKH